MITQDKYFIQYWGDLTKERQTHFVSVCRRIDDFCVGDVNNIHKIHKDIHEETKRLFVVVQEKDFKYSSVSPDWIEFARDQDAKKMLYCKAKGGLEKFVQGLPKECTPYLYGGIKNIASVDRSYEKRRGKDGAIQKKVIDYWDLVRFRLLAKNCAATKDIAVAFWRYFFNEIIRCRNYYYRPRYGFSPDSYRGIHYQIEFAEKRMCEVQILSEARDVCNHLDYAFFFKPQIDFVDAGHQEWLQLFRLKANILDVK